MPDFELVHKAALAGAKSSRARSASSSSSGLILRALPEGRLLHVLGGPNCGDLAPLLTKICVGAVRYAGPGQWFIADDEPIAASELASLSAQLEGRAAISDQSHGRVRIGISGIRASDLLAKGTAVDLDLSAFPPGKSAMTLFGHIPVNLARTNPESFELIVLRGFAESLWEELAHLGLEYGVTCDLS